MYVCVKGMTFSTPGPGLKTSLKISESKKLLHFIGSRDKLGFDVVAETAAALQKRSKKPVHQDAYIKGSKDKHLSLFLVNMCVSISTVVVLLTPVHSLINGG